MKNTKLTQREQLELQNTTGKTNTDKQHSTELVHKEHVEGTGFDIVGDEEHGYFVALGQYRITKFQPKQECRHMIETKDYELLLGLIGAVMESVRTHTHEVPPHTHTGIHTHGTDDQGNPIITPNDRSVNDSVPVELHVPDGDSEEERLRNTMDRVDKENRRLDDWNRNIR